jgi:subtilisin family serine protease
MRTREVVWALALANAVCLPAGASGVDEEAESALPALGAGLSIPVLVAAGVAATAVLAGGGNSGGTAASGAGTSTRTRSYTSAADFQTSEYGAQQGLRMVGADVLYYNGHDRWYAGSAPSPAAGTGIGVKIAVADTGINPAEARTGGAIAIDAGASYDYVNNRAGSAADDYGHGTHVAGIIAAPKNGAGMHGLAYNASVVNFKVGNSSGTITASDAQRADMLYRAAGAGAMVINNSWASGSAVTSFTVEQLQPSMAQMIEASRAYVARGGVIVFAAGNAGASQPAVEAGLPHLIAGIQAGWLAVVAVDGSGALASYSNRCGVAAAWCLAAPGGGPGGGLYSMYNDGGYASMYGTSMAAPHAAAALGALKSMFPNLSYLQIRDRLLFTANRSGTYGNAAAYGQGLMDLAAASSPVGGIALPTGTSASGATAVVSGSQVEFQAGALRVLGMQGRVLVVDNYQRAPFWVPAQALFREATAPRLVERQWASLRSAPGRSMEKDGPLRFSHASGLSDAASADLAAYRLGFSKGAGGEAMLGSHLELAWIPRLAAPALDSVALGYASDFGRVRIGLLGSVPALQATSERTLDSSSLGSRKALGMIAQQRTGATIYGASLAFADDFERPVGMSTSGAFGVGGSAALSSGAFVEQAIGGRTTLNAALEVARHRPQANGLLATPGYAVLSVNLAARTLLRPGTALAASFKRERAGSEAARLQVPLTIAENGDIGRVTYTLPYDDLVGRTALTLRLDHAVTKRVDLRAALTHERYGFGVSVTGIAALLEIAN